MESNSTVTDIIIVFYSVLNTRKATDAPAPTGSCRITPG
jgi:hypothetical protein